MAEDSRWLETTDKKKLKRHEISSVHINVDGDLSDIRSDRYIQILKIKVWILYDSVNDITQSPHF